MSTKECKFCKKDIHSDARICRYCGTDTRLPLRFLKITGLINIVAILVLSFSIVQFKSTFKERIAAEDAAEAAKLAQESASRISKYSTVV